jgi:voltage-gated potassium channel
MPTASRHALIALVQRHRFAVLLATQLTLLITVPFVQMLGWGLPPIAVRLIIGVPFVALVASTLVAVSDSRRMRMVALLLAVPTILLEVLDVAHSGKGIHTANHIFTVLFLGVVIAAILRFIFRSDRVNSDVIFASLCVYVMLGTLWAYLYAFIESVVPGSFCYTATHLIHEPPLDIGGLQSITAFYFSFVTMTTLGYGDMYPVSSIAKMTASLQAIVGQLYLTVLVARLVGLHIAHSAAEREKQRNK